MMKLSQALNQYQTILENGPLGTRLKYDYQFDSPPHLIVEQEKGRLALTEIYLGDIAVAKEKNIPIIVNAPTFRASRNHLREHGFNNYSDIKAINLACLNFTKNICDREKSSNPLIIFGAPVGSMMDAYSVNSSITENTAKEYHLEQLSIFKECEFDFVNVVTISSLAEALGISFAAQENNLDYTIGFVLGSDGHLLDGSKLSDAIRIIDDETTKKPSGYLITCTHASIVQKLNPEITEYKRLIGVQLNASDLSKNILSNMKTSVGDSPERFARDIHDIKKKFDLTIVGGCCGTSREHLWALEKTFNSVSTI